MTAVDAAHFAGEPSRILDFARRAEAIPAFPRTTSATFRCPTTSAGCLRAPRRHEPRRAAYWMPRTRWPRSSTIPIHLLYAAATGLHSGRGDTEQLVPRAVARARALECDRRSPPRVRLRRARCRHRRLSRPGGSQASEGMRIARETGQETLACALLAALAKVAALRGDEDECRAYAQESLGVAVPRRLGLAIALASEALGLLDLGLGRPGQAMVGSRSIARAGPGAGHPFVAVTTATYRWRPPCGPAAAIWPKRSRPGSPRGQSAPLLVNAQRPPTVERWWATAPGGQTPTSDGSGQRGTSRMRCAFSPHPCRSGGPGSS